MKTELMLKARARRRIALTHISGRNRDTSKLNAFRRMASMSPAELSEALVARRAHRVENIFAV